MSVCIVYGLFRGESGFCFEGMLNKGLFVEYLRGCFVLCLVGVMCWCWMFRLCILQCWLGRF